MMMAIRKRLWPAQASHRKKKRNRRHGTTWYLMFATDDQPSPAREAGLGANLLDPQPIRPKQPKKKTAKLGKRGGT